jgi:hypothetical protein
MLFAVEMALICPEAPSACQNPGEFPKGIKASAGIKTYVAAFADMTPKQSLPNKRV